MLFFTLIVVFGMVGADANWSSSSFAICLLSLISCPLYYSGATSMLSCFLDFTYFQNGLTVVFIHAFYDCGVYILS
jgi:hypothetical protein